MMESVLSTLTHLFPVILAGILAFFGSLLNFWMIKKLFYKSKLSGDTPIGKLRSPITLIIVITVLYIASNIEFDNINNIWTDVFKVSIILSITWLLVNFAAVGRDAIINQFDISKEDNLKARKAYTQVKVFERIVTVIIVIVGIALSLMTFEDVKAFGTSLLASAGVAGIIIGVAAQKLIANLLAGFQIAITQPIRINDAVIMENEWGWIEEITLTYVVVRIWDKRRLIVPSAQIIDKPFQNWTRNSSEIIGTVFIYTDYKMPVDALREELTHILGSTHLWDKQVNVLQVTNCTDRTMELRALVSAKNSPTAWDLRVYVREKLIAFMQEQYPDFLPRTRVSLKEN